MLHVGRRRLVATWWGFHGNAQGKRRWSTEGAEGTNTGHENGEAMASVGVRLTAQLGCRWLQAMGRFICICFKRICNSLNVAAVLFREFRVRGHLDDTHA